MTMRYFERHATASEHAAMRSHICTIADTDDTSQQELIPVLPLAIVLFAGEGPFPM